MGWMMTRGSRAQVNTLRRAVSAALAGLALSLAFSSAAYAGSPWVLPEDRTVLQLDFRTEFANREFLPDGTNQRFPVNGRYSAQALGLTLRQGFAKGFEASVSLTYKALSYDADPITVLGPIGQDDDGEPINGQILPTFSVNRQVEGLSDVFLSVRYNLYKKALVITPELEVKIPTGYQGPTGTFRGDNPGLIPNEDGETFQEQRQGDVPAVDDVALGDGQVDITASMLFGAFIPASRTFARWSVGFRGRFGGAGQQVIGDAKIGQLIGDRFVIFAGSQAAFTVLEGNRVLGLSFATRNPDLPSQAFPANGFEVFDLRLDKDIVDFSGGGIFKAGPYELILSGGQIVYGKNVTETVFVSFTTTYRY